MMFYINIYNKKSGTTEKIDITPFNVKTLCPMCNCQFGVDLADIFADNGDNDLMTTRVFCVDCAKKVLENFGADLTNVPAEKLLVKTKDMSQINRD
ncbi:MAG: hypothetical protein LBM93_01420 [Oscillospiraceae bacterium]|jgi:hypothetical protein|nr:hypothetical protein [Oscillospiraceae bacterium]